MLNRLKLLWETPFQRFVFLGIVLFLTWDLFIFNIIIKSSAFDFWILHILQQQATWGLSLIFDIVKIQKNTIFIDSHATIIVVRACNGLNFMGAFLCFTLAFPRSIFSKVIFIPIGLLFIHALNVLRIIALTVVVKYYPSLFGIMHSWVFVIIIYASVFGISLFWIYITDKITKHDKTTTT